MNRWIATGVLLLTCAVFGTAWASQPTPNEVRRNVEQLCDQGRFAEATHLGMKSLLDARVRLGLSSELTADYLTVVAEVARRRGKLHLAQMLYGKALAIQASSAVAESAGHALVSEPNRLAALKQKCRSLCDSGHFSGAVHASMAELMRVRSDYGNSHPYAAQYTAVVGDVAQLRGKPYLASVLYYRAFAMLQDGMGTTVSRKIDKGIARGQDHLD